MAVENNDVVLVPRDTTGRGAYGYDSYYAQRDGRADAVWSSRNDPVHEWMLKQ